MASLQPKVEESQDLYIENTEFDKWKNILGHMLCKGCL